MKKLFLIITILLFGFLITPMALYAHPPENTTSLNLYLPESNSDSNIVSGIVDIPWPVVLSIIDGKIEYKDQTQINFKEHEAFFSNFLRDKVELKNNGSLCSFKFNEIPEISWNQVVFGTGLRLSFQFNCNQKLKTLTFTSLLFFRDQDEENVITVYKNKDDQRIKIKEFALTTWDKQAVFENNSLDKNIVDTKQKDSSLALLLITVFFTGLFIYRRSKKR